jgi:hypothetical protein
MDCDEGVVLLGKQLADGRHRDVPSRSTQAAAKIGPRNDQALLLFAVPAERWPCGKSI